MNKVILIGRLTGDPAIWDGKANVAKYTLAVDRSKEGADFVRCIAFDKGAEFAEKYLHKGMKIAVIGHIVTGSYNDKEGRKVFTTDIVVEHHEFCESKKDFPEPSNGFVEIPDDFENPFS